MDHELEFELLETATSVPAQSPGSTGRLRVAERPEPFVRPTLILRASESTDPRNPLATEVVFIEASAAVGKSTMANYLSASRRAPLLNLAEVPVSTGSLLALVSGLPYPPDPVQAFHRGDLPLIIDALDEGRLLSGETGFEKFMETTGELLLQNRAVPDRPKVIMFGRRDSTELARIALEATGGPRSSWLEVGFFGRDAAWGMIRAYAEAKAAKDAAYHAHPGPVGQLNEAYFDAIEAALGLGAGALWTSERGRAFAGYAPVLAAIGSLLAGMDNFIEVTNTLRATGAREAWDVIEAVLQEILDRERRRLGELLRGQITVPVPPEAYDSEEQLKLLNQFVHGQPLVGSGRVALRGRDEATYNTMVGQRLPEHPFVKQQGFSNPVLASVVLAHGVFHDLLRSVDLRLVADASRQPFLYRSLRRHLKTAPLIDGAYLGFVLNSFWNDPINKAPEVRRRERGVGDH
jgi:hypothetical protein